MKRSLINKIINLLVQANYLKEVKRTGWVIKGVEEAESVADHSWGVLFLAMLLADNAKVNKEKLLKMAVVHDLGEILPGDVRWEQGKKVIGLQTEKRNKELEVIRNLFKGYPGGKEYIGLLSEFNKQNSPEAKFLKKIEKLEMVLQAFVYERQGRNSKSLSEFWENADKYLNGTELELYLRKLEEMRKIQKT